MTLLRRICWTMLVLVTASSTLLANIPMVTCACSVPVKESKATEEPNAPTCCCCKPTPQPETCCSVKPAETPADEPDLLQVRAADCQKGVTQHAITSLEERHADLRELLGAAFAWCELSQFRTLTLPPAFSAIDHAMQEPPPTDLVVALQHFII